VQKQGFPKGGVDNGRAWLKNGKGKFPNKGKEKKRLFLKKGKCFNLHFEKRGFRRSEKKERRGFYRGRKGHGPPLGKKGLSASKSHKVKTGEKRGFRKGGGGGEVGCPTKKKRGHQLPWVGMPEKCREDLKNRREIEGGGKSMGLPMEKREKHRPRSHKRVITGGYALLNEKKKREALCERKETLLRKKGKKKRIRPTLKRERRASIRTIGKEAAQPCRRRRGRGKNEKSPPVGK